MLIVLPLSAQEIDLLNKRMKNPIKYSDLETGNTIQLEIKTTFSNWSNSISGDGNVMFTSDKILHKVNNQWEVIDVPYENHYKMEGQPYLTTDGDTLIYIENNDKMAQFHFYDIKNRKFSTPYLFSRDHMFQTIGHFSSNEDGSIFAFAVFYPGKDPSGYKIFCVQKDKNISNIDPNDNIFTTHEVADVAVIPSKIMLSSSGNRLFYRALTQDTFQTKVFYSDRLSYGWSDPQIIELSDIEIEDKSFAPFIYDIAKDGKMAAICCGNKGLAVIEEEQGQWSLPVYLDYFPSNFDYAQLSENGNILMLKAAQGPDDKYNKQFQMIKFSMDEKNDWQKENMTPANEYLIGDFLLSNDGKHLYWVTE